MNLKLLSYNIHKGFNLTTRFTLHGIRNAIREIDADLVFLQEVLGRHDRHQTRLPAVWPKESQHHFLAEDSWSHTIYAQNAIYQAGHHGNAILSRFPIHTWENLDLSMHRFERRGLLHGQMTLQDQTVHVMCTHLDLLPITRKPQLEKICRTIQAMVAPHEPLILAGDFNDWSHSAQDVILPELGLHEVFLKHQGSFAKSFPVGLPLLALDRIYVRGFDVLEASVLNDNMWNQLSDHSPLYTEIKLK